MAKIAMVTYGTGGDTQEYPYMVDDSVRAGDWLHPSVKHWKDGSIFGTTGIVQTTSKPSSARGKEWQQDAESAGVEIAPAMTGSAAGAQRAGIGWYEGLGRTQRDPEDGKRKIAADRKFEMNDYIDETREANVQLRKQVGDTYDSYMARAQRGEG